MAEAETLKGGCHCGTVEYRVTIPKPERAMACNCSICSRAGWLLTFTPATAFELVSGEDALRDYQFAGHKLHHVFCGTCGVRSFSRGEGHDGSPWVSINLRCVEGIDVEGLEIDLYDGASV